jgi:tetratricopeptide (TPR) repeat protein
MQLPRLKFPHIPRLFSALSFVVWGLFILLFVINIKVASKNPSPFTSAYDSPLTNPFSANSHIAAALSLWNQGLRDSAKNEILLAQDLSDPGSPSVLGVATSPSVLLEKWESQPKQLQGDYAFWKLVADTKPDYRDGLIMAGLYAYQLDKIDEARGYFQKALDLDPNYQPLNTLMEKIGK